MSGWRVDRAKFRAGAVLVGILLVVLTTLVHSNVWAALIVGTIFGAGGFLFDYATRSRYFGGSVSAWALAAGGAVTGILWQQSALGLDSKIVGVWVAGGQYVGVVLVWWGLLMMLPDRRATSGS
jgi:hypothetical protein